MIDREGLREIGFSKVELSRSECNYGECNIGDFVADAFAHSMIIEAEAEDWSFAPVVLLASGGIRTSLSRGVLTYADLVAAVPFEDTLDTVDLRGDHLLMALEFAASDWDKDRLTGAKILQVSGAYNENTFFVIKLYNSKKIRLLRRLEASDEHDEPRRPTSCLGGCALSKMHGPDIFTAR